MKSIIFSILTVLVLHSIVIGYGPGSYGTWHSEINNSFRPRLLLTSSDKITVQSRLSQSIYNSIYRKNYSEAHRSAELRTNWKETAARSYIAKNAAYVYYMNRREDGITALDPADRLSLRDKVVQYLLELNASVENDAYDTGVFFRMQWRGKELMNYCEAYDLIMGDADSYILANKDAIETKLHTFTANLFSTLDNWKDISWERWLIIKQYYPDFTSKSNPRIMGACAVGIAALTIGNKGCDYPTRTSEIDNRKYRADSWIGAAMCTIDYLLRTNSSESMVTSDGSYREGPHYMRYIGTIFLPFIKSMKNFETVLRQNNPSLPSPWIESYYNFGDDWDESYSIQSPYTNTMYQTIYDYYTKIRQPDGNLPAIKDTFMKDHFTELALMADYKAFYSWPIKSTDPNISDTDLLVSELEMAGADSRADYICAGHLATNTGIPVEWKQQNLTSAGSYVYRSSWDTDGLYFHLHGNNAPWGYTGHYQEDASSFILNLGGQAMAVDPGYVSADQADYVNKARHHNVILVNNGGISSTTRFYQHFVFNTEKLFCFKINDNSSPESSNRSRTLIGLKDQANPYVISYDECNYSSSNEFKLRLHGFGKISDSKCEINPTDHTIRWWDYSGGKSLKAYSRSIPEGVFGNNLSEHEVTYNVIGYHEALEYKVNSTWVKYLTVLDCYTSLPKVVTDISQSGNNYKAYLIDKGASSPNFELVFMSPL